MTSTLMQPFAMSVISYHTSVEQDRTVVIQVIYGRREFIRLQWSVHIRYVISYILFNCPLSSLL